MVQESTNVFSDGIIKDINSMSVPKSALTDATNATLLTFNGNELVLQNDMGNAAIKDAELKDGYNPIGIKEYGGILYIISQNSDGRVEIGSFPSPKQSVLETNNTNEKIINIASTGEGLNKNYILSTEKINPGDKFLIVLKLSNQDLISYKNNKKFYKLKLLLLNENKEIDITDSLQLQYKYNEISKTFTKTNYWFVPLDESESIDILNYTNYFQVLNQKVGGKLAIRVELETIDSFEIDNNPLVNNSYPILEPDDTNKKLIFNIKSTFSGKIKLNKIYYYFRTIDKTGTVADIEEDPVIVEFNNVGNSITTVYTKTFTGDISNKILEYEIIPVNTNYGIAFTEFSLKNKIDLTKDPLSYKIVPFYKIINSSAIVDGEYTYYYLIGKFAYINNTDLKELDANDDPVTPSTKQVVYKLEGTTKDLSNYNVIGTYTINMTNNLAENFKYLNNTTSKDTCLDIVRFKNVPGIKGYIYNGFAKAHRNSSLINGWRLPTSDELISLINTYPNANDLKATDSWLSNGTNNSKFSALKTGAILVDESIYITYEYGVFYWSSNRSLIECLALLEGATTASITPFDYKSGACIRLVSSDAFPAAPVDYNGRIYAYAKINNLWWMIEDLKTNTYMDGTTIPRGTDINNWLNGESPFYIESPNE